MIEWEVTESGLRVFDAGTAEMRLRSPDLSVDGDGESIPRPIDMTVGLAASEIRLPVAVVRAATESGDTQVELGDDTGPIRLPEGRLVVDVDTEIKTYLAVDGPATLRKTGGFEEVVLSLPSRTAITVGFRSRTQQPTDTITTPVTPRASRGS